MKKILDISSTVPICIPRWICKIKASELSSDAKILFGFIVGNLDDDCDVCFGNVFRETGLNENRVIKSLKQLESLNIIKATECIYIPGYLSIGFPENNYFSMEGV